MSFCRWSSDNWACDLYCYADVSGGYTTHVANHRLAEAAPPVPSDPIDPNWAAALREQHVWLRSAQRVPIGLAFDGDTYNDPTLETFLGRLLLLREAGYRFPDYVIDDVRQEIINERIVAETPPINRH